MKPLQWPQFVTRDKENHEILPYEAFNLHKKLQWPQFVTRDKENHEILPMKPLLCTKSCNGLNLLQEARKIMKYYHMKPLQWPQFVTRGKENHEILPFYTNALVYCRNKPIS